MVLNDEVARAKSIFLGALEQCGPDELAGFVERECQGNGSLRRQVDRLLAGHRKDVDLAQEGEAALKQVLPTVATLPEEQMKAGTQIGPYKLREQIGEGGMGVVYVAEQTTPVKRKVALKIIKPGMASRDVVARFEVERQALAMMDHPNIARIIDAGTLDTPLAPAGRGVGGEGVGQPYFVMELVQGLAITDYCDEHKISTADRLKLFAKVCRAVQHAHQKGIIHRDLKPSNIIVSEIDDTAVPKVIDFGVAKAVGHTLTDATLYTQFLQMVGTPLYMSPEQAGLGVVEVDTRSDVYSLGVLLYELLTGNTPFDSETLKQAGFDEMRRIIREDEPLKPSAMVSTLKAEALSTVSQRRGSDSRKLSESLSGELDWLVMKALEKDRNRRYESASALAEDVERYLADEPIAAGPPSAAYRLKKYAQRNKGRLIATGLAAAVLLIGGGVTINAQVQQARKQRAIEQDVEQSLAEARTALETGNLAVAQQRVDAAEGRIAAAREQLHDLAGRVDALDAEVSRRREQLERLQRFEHLAHEAMDHGSNRHGLDIKDRLREALNTYGVLEDDRWLEKLQQSELSKEQQRRVRSTAYQVLLLLAERIGDAAEDAEELSPVEECLELLEKATKFHDSTRVFYLLRSNFHKKLGNSEQADLDRQQFETTAASIALDHYLSGQIAAFSGDDEEAVRSYEAALRLEPDHFNSLFFLAYRLLGLGEEQRAADLYRACLALRPDHVPSLRHRARLLAYERQFSEASELAEKAYQLAPTAKHLKILAEIHWRKGELHLALEDIAKAIEVAKPGDESLGSAHFHRGQILGDLGRHEEAILAMTKAIELPSSVLPGMDYVCRGQLYYRQGKHEQAIADYNRGIEAFSDPGRQIAPHRRARTYINRSIIQWSAGSYEDALAGVHGAIEIFPDNAELYRRLAWLLLSCPEANLRNYPDALELATKAVELEPENDQIGILALARYRTGDFAGTVDTYMRMFEKAKLKAGELLVLAMAHHQLGHQQDAREWYVKALKEYPKAVREIAKLAESESIHEIPDKNLKEISEAWLADVRSEAKQLLGITEEDGQVDSDGQAADTTQETDQPTNSSRDGETAQPAGK